MAGCPANYMGRPVYAIVFRAAVSVGEKCYWKKYTAPMTIDGHWVEADIADWNELTDHQRQALSQGREIPQVTPIPRGAVYVVEGKPLFRRTDRGWAREARYGTEKGYCADKSVEECYDEHIQGLPPAPYPERDGSRFP